MDFFCFWSSYTQRGKNAASGCQLPIPRGTLSENPLATLAWRSEQHLCSPSCPPLQIPLSHLQPCSRVLQGPALPLCLYSLRTQTDRMADTDFPFPVDLLSHQLLPSSPFPCLYVNHPPKPRKTFYLGHPGATPGTDSEALSPGNPQISHIPQIQRGQTNQRTDYPTNKGKPVINAQNHNHSNPRCLETAQKHTR